MTQSSIRRIDVAIGHVAPVQPSADLAPDATGTSPPLFPAGRGVIGEEDRDGPEAAPGLLAAAAPAPDSVLRRWSSLPILALTAEALDRNLVVAATRENPVQATFAVLRTRLVQALAQKGWRRVGITSPTKGCGKSFTAVNLAVSLSRLADCRTVLLDMDMRRPALARTLGVRATSAVADLLRDLVPIEEAFHRLGPEALGIGGSLAVGLSDRAEAYSAEIISQHGTGGALARIEAALDPRVVLFDLPPALAHDDVIAMKPHLDCVLMVAAGGTSTSRDLRETTRRLGDDLPVLGVVLNRGQGKDASGYTY